MRMHNHGKCTPNIILGALTVFCIIVLYNYWTVSTVNHDLIIKLHRLEETIVTISKANDALQANLAKVEEIKLKVEGNLKKEQEIDVKAKQEIVDKARRIKTLQNDLENTKQAAQNCRDELTTAEHNTKSKENEISTLKAKLVTLEAQSVEKSSKVASLENQVKELTKRLADKASSSTAASKGPSSGKDVLQVHAAEDDQPVLMNDPAVPYPDDWMSPKRLKNHPMHVSIVTEGDKGVNRRREMGNVLIFDSPSMPRIKPRFSVVDPPKNEMKPDSVKQPETLNKPVLQAQDDANGGEEFNGPPGVLPPPHNHQPKGQNLDAAEDDGDRVIKDDFVMQDDQSPDGALSQKEMNALPPPHGNDIRHGDDTLINNINRFNNVL